MQVISSVFVVCVLGPSLSAWVISRTLSTAVIVFRDPERGLYNLELDDYS